MNQNKKRRSVILQTEQYRISPVKKICNEVFFLRTSCTLELIPSPQESDESGEKAWVSLALVEL